MNKRRLIIIVLTFIYLSSTAQEIKNMQEVFLETEYFFLNEDYSDALPLYFAAI